MVNLPVNILVQLLWHIVAAIQKVRNFHEIRKKLTENHIPYLTTCITLGMSSPLAATAVATRIGILPVLKSSKAWKSFISIKTLEINRDGTERHCLFYIIDYFTSFTLFFNFLDTLFWQNQTLIYGQGRWGHRDALFLRLLCTIPGNISSALLPHGMRT